MRRLKIKQSHGQFHRKMGFWLKISISICQSSMVHEGCCMIISRLGWKPESIDSLLKRIHKTATTQRQTARRVAAEKSLCSVRSSQKGTDQLVRFRVKLLCLFKCAQDNSLWCPAQMLHFGTPSILSYFPSHALINNLIVCNKSCYCSKSCYCFKT